MGLTKRAIDAAGYDGRQTKTGWSRFILWDGDLPGFGLRIFPSGEKTFVLRYRNEGGRDRMMTLGKYGVMTLSQARDRAKVELLKVGTGQDPLEQKQAARRGATVREFAKVYMDQHAKKHKRSWKEDQRRLDAYVLPVIGHLRLDAVKRANAAGLHSKVGQTAPVEANRALALVSVMFSKAIEWGYLDEDAANPAARVKKFRETSRDRWVKEHEMPALVEAINAEDNIFVRGVFWVLLLTGLRRSELLSMKWADIDFDRKEVRIGRTKSGRPHVLALSAPALLILEELPRLEGNLYVFAGDRPGRPLVNIGRSWSRIRSRLWLTTHPEEAEGLRRKAAADVRRRPKHSSRSEEAVTTRLLALAWKEAKVEDLRLHDLRRTVGSWMANHGASLPLIGKVLNHSNPSTTQIYARIAEDPTRTVLEEHGARLVRAGMGKRQQRGTRA